MTKQLTGLPNTIAASLSLSRWRVQNQGQMFIYLSKALSSPASCGFYDTVNEIQINSFLPFSHNKHTKNINVHLGVLLQQQFSSAVSIIS